MTNNTENGSKSTTADGEQFESIESFNPVCYGTVYTKP